MATPGPVKAGGVEAHDLNSSGAKPSSTGHEAEASQPQQTSTQHIRTHPSLHLDKDLITSSVKVKPRESGQTDKVQAPESGTQKFQHILSFQSEQMVGKNLEELSNLRSPILREILYRLEEKYNVKPPVSERSTGPGREQKWRSPFSEIQVAPRWREIQGSNLWAGLLDPIDPVLRAEIVRYGEFSQATYDCFDNDQNSKYCGSCKFTKDLFFDKLELDFCGYEVTHYLYATAQLDLPNFFAKSFLEDTWSKDSNWIGYVAVTTSPAEIARLGRRDIVIAWRGTVTKFEWIKDVQDYAAPASFDPRHGNDSVMVESGFLSVYTSSNAQSRYNTKSVRAQVLTAVRELIEKYKDDELSITVTGHSLGSALATLCAYDLAESQMNFASSELQLPRFWSEQDPSLKSPLPLRTGSNPTEKKTAREGAPSGKDVQSPRIPIAVFSFAGPRVGNLAFRQRVKELGVAVLRVANKHDLVTKVPGVLLEHLFSVLQPILPFVPSYKHVGVKLSIDHLNSHFLEPKFDLGNAHNLEGYLHLVDGFHGTGLPFQPTLRDFALVNKRSCFLRREYYIPANWWQEAFKGLQRDEQGHWLVPPRDLEIFPATPAPMSQQELQKEEAATEAFFASVSVAARRAIERAETQRAKETVSEGDSSKSSLSEVTPPSTSKSSLSEVTPSDKVNPPTSKVPPTSEAAPSQKKT